VKLVLDTHAAIFALASPRKLGRAARAALARVERGRDEAWIPAAVVVEIVLLHELGRTTVGIAQIRAAIEANSNLHFLPLDLAQLDAFAGTGATRDPFDRLILAAARSIGATLVSKDERLATSGLIEVLWN
jgi:PIN domain nuclease of toxin-antitoxin system